MTKNLSDYVKNNSKFLNIQDGESVELVYKGYSIVADKFNPGKETVSYLFQDENGKTIPWNKSSNRIATQMNKINVGESVKITRYGESFETKYKIQPVNPTVLRGAPEPQMEMEPDESPI